MIHSDDGIFEGEDGLVLRWQTWTPERPRARVLLAHGLGEHSGRYAMVAGALAGRGFAVFTYDQRGHGRSQGPRGHADTFEVLVRDLGHAVHESRVRLPGTLTEAIVAHSMGGLVALRYLQSFAEEPPSAAVISAPWLKTKRTIAGWIPPIARVLDRLWPSAPLDRGVDPTRLTRDPVMIEAYRADRYVHGKLSPRLFFEVERAQVRVLEHKQAFTFPTMFLIPVETRSSIRRPRRHSRGGWTVTSRCSNCRDFATSPSTKSSAKTSWARWEIG